MDTSPTKGFIALITVVIISTILLSLAASVSTNTFFARFNGLNREYKKISRELAEACVHTALAKIGSDYTYRTVTDPDYSSSLGGVRVHLGSIYNKDVECVILGPATTPPEINDKRTFPITTRASYGGAFSTMTVLASAQNPEEAPSTPPPTCALSASPASIPLGESVTLTWSVSGNATHMSINQGIGAVNPLQTSGPWPTNTPTGIGSKTFVATVGNSSGDTTCSASVTIAAPPPSPECADTVFLLDRTGSMSASDRANERNAGNALVTLYESVDSNPYIGVGSFGGLSGGPASIPTSPSGLLSNNYATIRNAINTLTNTTSSVGSNLGAAISVGANELNSVRHDPLKEKVLLFVSDGVANEPSSSLTASTSRMLPTSNLANGVSDFWNTPTGAYQSGVATSTVPRSHQYRDFNFSIPTGATIRGIEVQATVFSSSGASQTLLTENFGTGSGNVNDIVGWDEEGTDSDTSTLAFGATSGNDSVSPSGGKFARIAQDEWICRSINATNLYNLILSFDYRGDTDAESSDRFIVEYRTGTDCSASSGWSSITSIGLDQNDTSWGGQSLSLPSGTQNTNFLLRMRVDSDNSNELGRVDGITLTGTSQLCSLAFDLSHNGGSSWTSKKNQALSASAQTYTLGSATDTWGRTWNTNELGNSNFRVRVGNTTTGPLCSLDNLTTRVHYSQSTDPTQYARDAANSAKGDDISIFSIHYGDVAGQNLMLELSSVSSLPDVGITSIVRAGGTVTVTTSAPHRLMTNQFVTITGVPSTLSGSFKITSVLSANSFRYAQSGSNASNASGNAKPRNLFASPASSAMTDIFEAIGYQVCPAAAPECSNGIDDDRDGQIDTSDSACHTDDDAGNASSYDALDEDEWSDPVPPAPPLPPPPPSNIIIESWVETP